MTRLEAYCSFAIHLLLAVVIVGSLVAAAGEVLCTFAASLS